MATSIENEKNGQESRHSTSHTLPAPLSRTVTKESQRRQSRSPTVTGHGDPENVDIEDAAAGAVEDDHKHDQDDPVPKDWATDPTNPRNWSPGRKWATAAIVSMYTFVSPLASSMMAPALPEIAIGYHEYNPTIIALTLSIYILAYALGPLFLAPLSEVYGRTWILHISNLVFIAFNVACALAPTLSDLIGFRFMAGLAGSAPLAIGAGSITDLFAEENRAAAMGIFSLGPLIGPVVGPVAGGFINQGLNYHWVFWIIAILGGVASLVGIPLLRETYAPVILARRAKAEGRQPKHQPHVGEVLWVNLTRPIVLLTRSFICFILSLYMAIIYGILYLLFVTIPTLFSDTYGWSSGVVGLAYLGPGIGFIIGTSIAARTMDKIYLKLRERNGGVAMPEHRIPIMFFGSLLIPVGLLWYGWSADKGVFWIVPIIGMTIFGAGMMICFMGVYLVDSFKYAASAVAAATLLRSLFGFAFPLFATRIFETLGVGGGYSLVAGIAVVVGWPFPVLIYFKGAAIRAKSDLNR